MPDACSLSAHLTGKTDHLMVSYGTAYVILFLIQLVNLSSYSLFVLAFFTYRKSWC